MEDLSMKKLTALTLTAALALSAFSFTAFADEDKTITVAASATPHSEILEQAKALLAEQGYELEITIFDDYILPQMSAYTGSDHNPLISFLKILYFILFFMILMGFIFLVYLNRVSLDKKRSWMSKAAGMPLFRQMNSLQFSRILQSLLNKGISTQECFEIMYTMDFNPFIYCSVDHVLKALNHGQTLEKAFESCIFFDSVFIKLTRLGLFSGSLERVLVLYNQTTMNLIKEKIHKICIWIQAFSYFGVGIVVMVVYQVLLMPLEMFNSI
jgi:hypothetical protein